MIRYKCERCRATLESPPSMAGQQDQCPLCKHVCTVPQRKKGVGKIVALCLVGLLAVAIIVGSGLWIVGNSREGPITRALSLAPPDAQGVIHIDVAPIVDEIFTSIRKNREKLGLPPQMNLDDIEKFYRRVETFDMFFLDTRADLPYITVARTDLTPKEFQGVVTTITGWTPPVKKTGNGRYDYADRVRIIYGGEAKDVPKGYLVTGSPKLLTDEFVARLGQGGNDYLRSALADVNTSAPLWGAGTLKFAGKNAPEKVAGWVSPNGQALGQVRLAFAEEEFARQMVEEVERVSSPPGKNLREIIEVSRDEKTVLLAVKPVEDLIPRAIGVMVELLQAKDSVAALDGELNFQCTACNFEFTKSGKEMEKIIATALMPEMGLLQVDCPKCGKKESCLMQTKCPKCGKYYLSEMMVANAKAFDEAKAAAKAEGKDPSTVMPVFAQGQEPKDVCTHCGTDRVQWYIDFYKKKR
ncbi:MAG TPA: hypothetical protein PKG77_01285 [Phycisphaerae bacterium]|nr:hypothetical protein [Phycisphaerae bacterium]HQL73108.1 hypothetical protein [Phycisphaerae bacterium]